jgi:16S rRNA (cytidine1402-2'-O)-methyltransferase
MTGRLYVCSTPIGNLEDSSLRLVRVLGEVDVVAAEDTRRTRKLLSHHGIRARLVSYHQANEREAAAKLIERLRRGESVALVTDSGTPLVSDPGFRLVRGAIEAAVVVEAVPGPSAVLAALAVSGLGAARFAFEGFLPRKQGDRKRRLEAIAADDRTLVFFESPNRLAPTLADLEEALGDRPAAVARELTKFHEEVTRGPLSELRIKAAAAEVLGEVVIVVDGCRPEPDPASAVARARELMNKGESKSRAAGAAAQEFGVPKSVVYDELLKEG